MAFIRLISQTSEEEYRRQKALRNERDERERQEYAEIQRSRRQRMREIRKRLKVEQQLADAEQAKKEKAAQRRTQRAQRRLTAEYLAKQTRRAGRPMPDACEICGEDRELVFDHCHAKGHFRGWICTRCNTLLGRAGDNETLLQKMADYLKRDRLALPR